MAGGIKALESSMRELQQSCWELGSHKHFDEFFQIIRHTGWTTVLDALFVGAMIASMEDQLQNVTKHLENLRKPSVTSGRPTN